ncbi:hypothetical protein GCM10010317_092320 [Streptomyces mirabilis]|uniref:hypothetical protein n=1 Tax=Streptomyces mirabilis TaxID=68239 RepID=UPI00167C5279|nr:hypothetical protein [Streptomyces mirabilis]GHD76252.1 hypothetical protein GCM10010317_092320 [Streptomyces mirabilis]
MPQAGQAGDLVDERAREQAPRRHLAVPVEVVEHHLVVRRGAVAPVHDLLAGQLLEDQLLVDDEGLRLRHGGRRAGSGQHDRGLQRGWPIKGGTRGRGVGTGLGGLRLPSALLFPPVLAGPRLGGHGLVQLPLGCRTALRLGGVRHRGVDGGRDRVPLGTAAGLPVLAPRAVPAGVEQHAVVAQPVAALLPLGQALADQPAHRVLDRTAPPQLVLQAPGEPAGEDLPCVDPADESAHRGQLGTGGGLHQAAGSRTLQTRPHQPDRSQDHPQILRRQRHPPPLLPALTRTVHGPHRGAGHRPAAGPLAARRRGFLLLFPAQRAVRSIQPQPVTGMAIHGLVLALMHALRPTAFSTTAFAGKPSRERKRPTMSNHRSVGSVVLCSCGEVCRSPVLALPGAGHPSNHKGLARLAGLKISGCSTGEV